IPIRKVSSAEGKVKEECKRRSPRLSVKRAPTKTNAKPRKMAGKDKSWDKNVQIKGKRGEKRKQIEVAKLETKDLTVENVERNMRRVQPLMKQNRKKPNQINYSYTMS
uniref:Uncharacterized protein n=1 Tax=Sciurus vulgaris TaxID=55149 RepID=A0A8D2B7J6_SCIVU